MNRPKSPGSGPRVLLVEDHPFLGEATADFMRSRGWTVRIASTGQEALEIAVGFHPDIVICDLRLPDITGIDVARALRTTSGSKDAVIAIHTAITDQELRRLRPDGTVNLYISKPITEGGLDSLLAAVQVRAKSRSKRKSENATGS